MKKYHELDSNQKEIYESLWDLRDVFDVLLEESYYYELGDPNPPRHRGYILVDHIANLSNIYLGKTKEYKGNSTQLELLS